jgi:UbiD family decarboxylase
MNPEAESRMSLGHYLTREDFEVQTIQENVDPEIDLSAYLMKDPSATMFFPRILVKGVVHKAVGNIWATREHVGASLNLPKEKITDALGSAMASPQPTNTVKTALFLENVIDDVDLTALPIPKYFEDDGGPYITAGIVIAKDGEGNVNVSFHRLMTRDAKTFGIRIVKRHLYKMFKDSVGDLDVAVVLGLTPAVLLPAAMSVDYGINELEIASALCQDRFGSPLDVYELDNGIPVPANAEYVFTGKLLKDSKADEGPFVDITGTYDIIREQPVMRIDRIYHRDKPIFQALLPGSLEHFLLMGLPREPVIAHEVGNAIAGGVVSVRLTEGGCCWLHGAVSIKKQTDSDGKSAIMAAFKGHRSMKRVIIVDDDIDIFNDRELEWAIATRFQADRDQLLLEERGSSLDPSRKEDDTTTKVGIDATKPLDAGDEFSKII